MKLKELKAALAKLPPSLDENEVYLNGGGRLSAVRQDLIGGEFIVAGKRATRLNIIRLSGADDD